MKPDTSHWREQHSYDFFDDLTNEGLAWECLRRQEQYQRRYRALAAANADTAPLSIGDQRRWGLRFPCAAKPLRVRANRLLVSRGCPVGADAHAGARLPFYRFATASRKV